MKKLRFNKKAAIIVISILIGLFILRSQIYLGPFYSFVLFLQDFPQAQRLQKILNATDWKEFKDEKLGYSYIIPESWVTAVTDYKTTDEHPAYGQEYKVSEHASPQAYINVVFYKNPNKNVLETFKKESKYYVDPNLRLINGLEYFVVHDTYRFNGGLKVGNFLLAKDYSLLVEARLGYLSDRGRLEAKKEIEIVNKIFNSIKKNI